jgi:hypothetical protein
MVDGVVSHPHHGTTQLAIQRNVFKQFITAMVEYLESKSGSTETEGLELQACLATMARN